MAEAQAAAMVQEMMIGGTSSNPAAVGHDAELQAAIEASKLDIEQKGSGCAGGGSMQNQDDSMDEAMAMAMALSLSEQDTGKKNRAQSTNQFLDISHYAHQDEYSLKMTPADEEEEDRKMPAKAVSAPISEVPIMKFVSTDPESLKADQSKAKESVATDDLLDLHIPVATLNAKKAGSVELVLSDDSLTGFASSTPRDNISPAPPQSVAPNKKENDLSSATFV